jgi:hypothetical protein
MHLIIFTCELLRASTDHTTSSYIITSDGIVSGAPYCIRSIESLHFTEQHCTGEALESASLIIPLGPCISTCNTHQARIPYRYGVVLLLEITVVPHSRATQSPEPKVP